MTKTTMVQDDDCPICQLEKKCEEEGREPTEKEINEAMFKR